LLDQSNFTCFDAPEICLLNGETRSSLRCSYQKLFKKHSPFFYFETGNRCDFGLTIEYDMNMNQLSCTIDASLDLFDQMTTQKMSQRFHSLLKQLFSPMNDEMNKSIYELSLILSDERLLMKSMNNTEIFVPSLSCIHHEFVSQVMKYPQKLSVELDDQSLTYCELLYYVQMLSLNLLNRYEIIPGEIICQCVERSLSMVS
jgi:non-ribosomal peptide synthetase component F